MAVAAAEFSIDSEGVYRCLPFDHFAWQKHGFGTRHTFPPPAAVTFKQVHGDRVRNAADITANDREGDALVTSEIGQAIAVRTADCVPILLLDARRRAIAAVHAGWRGTAAGIVARTVESLSDAFGSRPDALYAAIGPCIRPCCYQVGLEVAERLPAHVRPAGAGKYQLDLAQANRALLEASGVPSGQIFDTGLCTRCLADQFHSFRRNPADPGRMLSFICRLA